MAFDETETRKGISNGLMGSNYGEEIEYSPEASRLLNLFDSCEDVAVFKHGDRMYFGDKYSAVREYIRCNPEPSDFSVWLQQNYKEV